MNYYFSTDPVESKIIPKINTNEEDSGLDEEENNTGRVIGMLERIFILFVLVNQYAAMVLLLY